MQQAETVLCPCGGKRKGKILRRDASAILAGSLQHDGRVFGWRCEPRCRAEGRGATFKPETYVAVRSARSPHKYGAAISQKTGLACLAMFEHSDRHLSLWKKRLGSVPDWVWERTDLETLVLAENELCEISERIGCMKRLRMLDLGHNKLTDLPDTLSQLDALSDFLYLHDNKLSSLPACFEQLTKLRYLNISENAFEALPPCIFGMHGLVELRACDNRLTALPDYVERLSRLRELHLRNNALKTIPNSIAALHELRVIDLRGNPLTTLPKSLAKMPRLEKLDLRWTENFPLPEWIGNLENRGCLVYR